MKNPSPFLPGIELIPLKVFPDDRGFFTERYQVDRFSALGVPSVFIQDNHSRSEPRVVRGLHYQHSPAQGKLVGVIRGAIWDVVVDLRKNSPTFGQWQSFELSDENAELLWIPGGFAHGFCVLGREPADVIYKVDAPYSPTTEGGIFFADSTLQIPWPVETPIVSAKDRALPSFTEYQQKPAFS